jgi:hypothetical protein
MRNEDSQTRLMCSAQYVTSLSGTYPSPRESDKEVHVGVSFKDLDDGLMRRYDESDNQDENY